MSPRPCQNAVETLQKTLAIQGQYWGCLAPQLDSARLSHFECWGRERVGEERLREARERGEGREDTPLIGHTLTTNHLYQILKPIVHLISGLIPWRLTKSPPDLPAGMAALSVQQQRL